MGLIKSIAKGIFGSNKPQEPEKPEVEKPEQPQQQQPEQPQQQQPVEQPQQPKETNGEDLLPDAQTADTDEDAQTAPTVNATPIGASSQLSANAGATTASKFLGSTKHRPENLQEKSSNIVTKIKRGI